MDDEVGFLPKTKFRILQMNTFTPGNVSKLWQVKSIKVVKILQALAE